MVLSLLLWALLPGSLAGDYALKMQESVTVQQGLCVFIPCTFSHLQTNQETSEPAHGYWFQKSRGPINPKKDNPVVTNDLEKTVRNEKKGRFHLLGDPGASDCSLGIIGARQEDSGKYVFRVEKGSFKYSFKDQELTVSVAALTLVPDIFFAGSLESGHRGNVTCSVPWACDWGPPPNFSWMGTALWSQGSRSETRNSSAVTLTPGPQDHGTNLTCRVSFPRSEVTTERTVTLSVSYAPQNLSISFLRGDCGENLGNSSSLPVLEGVSLCFVCVADSSPPAMLNWTMDNLSLSPSQSSDPGVLELPRVQKKDEGEVTCRARNSLGSQHLTLHLSVLYPPELLGPSCSWEAEGLRCNCSARARPVPSLLWRVGDRLVEGNSSNTPVTVTSISEGPWVNSSLTLHEQLSLDLGLHCEARNDHGVYRVTVLQLPGQGGLEGPGALRWISLAPHSTAGSPKRWGGSVLAGALGAGLMALLCLCSCLIFLMVKTCRTKTARPAAGGPRGRSVSGDTSQDAQPESQPDSPSDDPPLPVATSPSGEEDQELHYASLVFQGLKPQEPQDQETTSTSEYSEIKIHK
ncbi:PREDICTED: sialic acid-binding Ig-like lectin 5-like [Elephantulus edwardii]|uniref:sialic acid-binding Ig-like lectin 5-like n=1 Tax=Elephantulus edwardii TaxID=28737 RepID=UPI0003F06671|nr:PREDICTED: sialic acid-binding Ig-like lectin 5-like [Elephantulus edwardii]